jgi:hypothetical protein
MGDLISPMVSMVIPLNQMAASCWWRKEDQPTIPIGNGRAVDLNGLKQGPRQKSLLSLILSIHSLPRGFFGF